LHVRKAYALLVASYSQLGNNQVAYEVCQRALRLFPKDAELRFREGGLLHDFGRLPEAAEAYRKVLETDEEPHFASVESGIKGYLTRHNLAVVYSEMGDWAGAEAEWRIVLTEAPNFRLAQSGLREALQRQVRENQTV
jgi:tetratricopeptide (TPR) repeat protein